MAAAVAAAIGGTASLSSVESRLVSGAGGGLSARLGAPAAWAAGVAAAGRLSATPAATGTACPGAVVSSLSRSAGPSPVSGLVASAFSACGACWPWPAGVAGPGPADAVAVAGRAPAAEARAGTPAGAPGTGGGAGRARGGAGCPCAGAGCPAWERAGRGVGAA